MTDILGFERVPGHAIVLGYKSLDIKNYENLIEEVNLVVGERRRDASGKCHEYVNLEKGHERIKKAFVNKDKTFKCLVYKKGNKGTLTKRLKVIGQDFLTHTYKPVVIDRYPQEIQEGTEQILNDIHMVFYPFKKYKF